MTRCVISLGSNLDGERQVEAAMARLADAFSDVVFSGLYSTAPMYQEDQPDFVNAIALVSCPSGPIQLFRNLKRWERELGRRPRERNGPREIDLDIVAFGRLRLRSDNPELQIPHPRAAERRFVLEPLSEISPAFVLSGLGTVQSLLTRPELKSQSLIRMRDAQISILSD